MSLTLKLIAAINVLFLISFLIVATPAAGKARAEIPACTGIDMLAALEETDPAAFGEDQKRGRRHAERHGICPARRADRAIPQDVLHRLGCWRLRSIQPRPAPASPEQRCGETA